MTQPLRRVCVRVTHCATSIAGCRYADIIIPWQRGDNIVAIDLITQHIKSKLSCHELVRHYPNLEIMPSNFQVGRADWDGGGGWC